MKQIFGLLIFFSAFLVKGQSSVYHPFPTSDANWVYTDIHGPYYATYAFNGDTVILGLNYKKVFENSNYAGALRESGKIIYFIPDTSSNEVVLYNFNLNLGDSVIRPYGGAVCANDTAIVDLVDSVLLSDGYHRILYFNSFAQWIEGVGAIHYFLEPCNVLCVSGGPYLECMLTDSGFSYPPNISSCIAGVLENSIEISEVVISPNPISDYGKIDLGENYRNSTMRTYSIQGSLVRVEKIEGVKVYEFSRGQLPRGVYFLNFVNNHSLQVNLKIIIE
ncbi:MAG: T9SS type A sorting domain-containing protein [Bacteroidetes bacterium]|nr:MAG: T9SS type A sorting domain-containing protein [Bacteroidota bacterium]